MGFLLNKPLPVALLVPLCACLALGDMLFFLTFMDLVTGVLTGSMSIVDAANPGYLVSKIGMSRSIAATFMGATPCSAMLGLLWFERYERAQAAAIPLLVLALAPLPYLFIAGTMLESVVVTLFNICVYVALTAVAFARLRKGQQ